LTLLSKVFDKLYLKQWSIGIADISIEDVIRNKKIDSKFIWIPVNNKHQFFADPFILKTSAEEYQILFEELDYNKRYGNISLIMLNNRNEVISKKLLLDIKSHLSYPFFFLENGNIYLFPESSEAGKLACYKYDSKIKSLEFVKNIIDLPLLDSTILKYEGKYWLFATMRGRDSNSKLYLFFSDQLLGPYRPHPLNPVKNNIDGSRPAGNFIEVDGNIFRPTQGSGKYYGASIIINKIIELSEDSFKEEYYFKITPSQKEYYNFGIHTINYMDQKIVIDGLVRRFLPFTQIGRFLSNRKKSVVK